MYSSMKVFAFKLGSLRLVNSLSQVCSMCTVSDSVNPVASDFSSFAVVAKQHSITRNTTAIEMVKYCKELCGKKSLDQVRPVIRRIFVQSKAELKNIDTFLWLFMRDHYLGMDKKIDVKEAFVLYLELAHPEIVADFLNCGVSDVEAVIENGKNSIIFFPFTVFNLLCFAYADYCNKEKNQVDKNEQLNVENIYKKMLDFVEKHESKAKRDRIHGAVLLAEKKTHLLPDLLNITSNSDKHTADKIVKILCKEALRLKKPDLVQILVDQPQLLPENRRLVTDVFNVLALLYAQDRHVKKLEKLCQDMVELDLSRVDLRNFNKVVSRIRTSYFMSGEMRKKYPETLDNLQDKIALNFL